MNINEFIQKCDDMSIAVESSSNVTKTDVTIVGDNPEKLLRVLAWIEYLGTVGHSTTFKVFVDGDGASRYKFKFDKDTRKIYNSVMSEIREEVKTSGRDIESFSLD